jgi:hypothetical protein
MWAGLSTQLPMLGHDGVFVLKHERLCPGGGRSSMPIVPLNEEHTLEERFRAPVQREVT